VLALVDVAYHDSRVVAACVCLNDWTSATPCFETTVVTQGPAAEYVPGAFFRRELPYLLGVLEALPATPAVVVVDGYVSLGQGRPGLGQHLHDALAGRAVVVGVAKTAYRGVVDALPVVRGRSTRPLLVSAAGMSVLEAARGVGAMAGPHRIPAMLKRVDRLSRAAS
jgi:deoxyribonuclease V